MINTTIPFKTGCPTKEHDKFVKLIREMQYQFNGSNDTGFCSNIFDNTVRNIHEMITYINGLAIYKVHSSRAIPFKAVIHAFNDLKAEKDKFSLYRSTSLYIQKLKPEQDFVTAMDVYVNNLNGNTDFIPLISDKTASTIPSDLTIPTNLTNSSNGVSVLKVLNFDTLKINDFHILQLKNVQMKLGYADDTFNLDLFTENPEKIIDSIKNFDLFNNTKDGYISAICIAMEYLIQISAYQKYKIGQKELELAILKENVARKIISFDLLIPIIRQVYGNPTNLKTMRVFALIILSNLNDDNSISNHEIGILRPSDYEQTVLINQNQKENDSIPTTDLEFSTLDLQTYAWHIKSCMTKNKQERVLKLSEDTVKKLRNIYMDVIPKFLLTNDYTKKYEYSSKQFKDYFTVTIGDIRASYFIWRANHGANREDLLKLCFNQGHRLETAMIDYYRGTDEN